MVKLDFAKGVSVVLTGATNWARLTEATGPDSLSEKYQVDLTLDAESVKTLESMKILEHMQPKDRAGNLKYEASTVRLKTNNAPTIWDTSKTVFKGNIGNGSTLRAKVLIKAYEMAGKKGLTAFIIAKIVAAKVAHNSCLRAYRVDSNASFTVERIKGNTKKGILNSTPLIAPPKSVE